ncbi:DUF424 family protein [Candidatus Woesearchaeota archaeon]|nr:DUF424 family protein [Candidatus Woesearchaeota archaeon]
MIAKKHLSGKKLILAVCDDALLGKRFSQDNLQVDLASEFYNGSHMGQDMLLSLINKAYIINAVGEETISMLKNIGLITEDNIIRISGMPVANILIDKA